MKRDDLSNDQAAQGLGRMQFDVASSRHKLCPPVMDPPLISRDVVDASSGCATAAPPPPPASTNTSAHVADVAVPASPERGVSLAPANTPVSARPNADCRHKGLGDMFVPLAVAAGVLAVVMLVESKKSSAAIPWKAQHLLARTFNRNQY